MGYSVLLFVVVNVLPLEERHHELHSKTSAVDERAFNA